MITCLVMVLATHFVAASAMGRCRTKAEERLDGLREPLLPKDGAAEASDADAKPPAHRQAHRCFLGVSMMCFLGAVFLTQGVSRSTVLRSLLQPVEACT